MKRYFKRIIRGINTNYVNTNCRQSLSLYKRTAISVCKDFQYTKVMSNCIDRIKFATTEKEITCILHTCRDLMFQ